MTIRTSAATSQAERQASELQRQAEPTNLSFLYGTIGIQAVAAAAQYAGSGTAAPAAPRIDQRFVETAR